MWAGTGPGEGGEEPGQGEGGEEPRPEPETGPGEGVEEPGPSEGVEEPGQGEVVEEPGQGEGGEEPGSGPTPPSSTSWWESGATRLAALPTPTRGRVRSASWSGNQLRITKFFKHKFQ